MKPIRKALAAAVAFAFAGAAQAIPTLQLDILGGTYDSATQTVMASANAFTLYAYLIPDADNLVTDKYYLSMAVLPQQSVSADLGSFTFNAATIDVTDDMIYGTPPIQTIAAAQGDLQTHSIFPTFFAEAEFQFTANQLSGQYNAQDDTGIGPQAVGAKNMNYVAFSLDVSGLSKDAAIHFDLYNSKVCDAALKKKDGGCEPDGFVTVTQFAPFSHDAQSTKGGGGGEEEIPEPGSLLLLGGGLLGLWATRRRMA